MMRAQDKLDECDELRRFCDLLDATVIALEDCDHMCDVRDELDPRAAIAAACAALVACKDRTEARLDDLVNCY